MGWSMQPPEYQPKPLDVSSIPVTGELSRLAGLLAENIHDTWAKARLEEGWRHGAKRDDTKREHPLLAPFDQLPEAERQHNREVALQTIRVLIAMGWKNEGGTNDLFAPAGLARLGREALDEIEARGKNLAGLRHFWEQRLTWVWDRDVKIHQRAVDAALKLGEAFLAYDIAQAGLKAFPGDVRLLQLQALALARTGATRRASGILEALRRSGHQDEETLGILARTHKDLWMMAPPGRGTGAPPAGQPRTLS